MAKTKWTLEILSEEALKYTTRADFQKSSKNAYLSAWRQNLIDEICTHMKPVRITWSLVSVTEEAVKYSSKSEFAKRSNGAYSWALKNCVIDTVTSHMKNQSVLWTFTAIATEAKKYTQRNAFKKGSNSAYQAACKTGAIEKVCSHMPTVQKSWNPQEIEMEAKKYTRRNEFKRNSYGAYQAASRNGVMEDICTHMEYEHSTFNYAAPAYLYYVKIVTKDGSIPDVYKVGVTGRSYILDRFYNDYRVTTTEVVVLRKLKFNTGKEAFNKEQEIKHKYVNYLYTGASPLVNTKTAEMFVQDLPDIGNDFRVCTEDGSPAE